MDAGRLAGHQPGAIERTDLSRVSGLEGVLPEGLSSIGGFEVTGAIANVARPPVYTRLRCGGGEKGRSGEASLTSVW